MDAKLTQSQFAELLGVNQSTISRAMSAGIIQKKDDWKTQLKEFVAHLEEVAAGRHSMGDLDLCQERARLARMQADKIELELAAQANELCYLEPIFAGIDAQHIAVKSKILSLPNRIKNEVPYITPADVGKIDDLIRRALTEIAEMRISKNIMAKLEKIKSAQEKRLGEEATLKHKPRRVAKKSPRQKTGVRR